MLPSLTDTDMVKDLQLFRWVKPITPAKVAEALVIGLKKNSPEILVGWQSHVAVWCQGLAPWLLEVILHIARPPVKDSQGSPTRQRFSKPKQSMKHLRKINLLG